MERNNEQGQGIRILSLDGGGPGCYSQLVILKEIMSRIAYDEDKEPEELLPGDHFDFIGGTGFGAYISFMLGTLRMDIDDTIDGLLTLADSLFPQCDPSIARSPDENLEVLRGIIGDMLKQHNLPKDIKLSDPQLRSSKSKVAMIAASADDVSHCELFRTYRSPQSSIKCTLLEALCASLAIPPLFDPIPIGPRLRQQRFIGGALGFYNPTREMLKEAKVAYGDDQRVALFLSLGSGVPPVMSLESSSSLSQNVEVLVQYMATDCERVAGEMANQMIQVDAYIRLNVNRGLEQLRFDDWSCVSSIRGCINAYLQAPAVTRAVDAASEKITKRIGSITVGQLTRSTRIKHMAKPVPPVSPYYVVRRDEWEVMTSHLVVNPEDKRKIFVITGMGGCGKTQMVAYFVEKHRRKYQNIFFIDATSAATIRGDLESAIRSLDGHKQDTYEDSLTMPYILDNADDPDLELNQYLPSCSHGTIVITSRNRRIGDFSTTHHLELGQMQEIEAVEILCRAARKTMPLDRSELTEAVHLVETLGYLALAIVQAGIYIHEMSSGRGGRFSFAQYFTLYKDHRQRLLRQKGRASLDQYPNGVYTTLDISYTKLPDQCREFLHLCSFFRHTNIVTSIFSCAAKTDFEDSWELEPRSTDQPDVKLRLQRIFGGKARWDELQFHEMIQVLSSFSLLFISCVNNILLLRLHPLVHSHARDQLDPAELPIYKQMAITCISTSYSHLPTIVHQYVLPHCIVLYEESGGELAHANDMIQFGQLMFEQGSYWLAEKTFRKVSDTLVSTQGHNGEDAIAVSIWLSSTFCMQGKWNEAEILQRDVLSMHQRVLGLEHPDTIHASAHLASTYHAQGKWNEAEILERDVLSMRQRILGPEHLDTINASANLASIYRAQGKWDEAETLERDVLSMCQRILGPEHPDTIDASANLASTLHAQGKWNEAAILERDVLSMCQRILGLEHPDTIRASAHLASTFHMQGKWNEAETLERDVLSM
ncbi:FabD/lysophospholipase-like protein, partial [Serendipita vermifera]